MPRVFALLLGSLLVSLGLVGRSDPERTTPVLPPESPKCPEHLHDWKAMVREHGIVQEKTIGTIPAAGASAGVPEAHDCQRLVSRTANGGLEYGPLGVLFGSHPMPDTFVSSGVGDYETMPRASATIYLAWDPYPALKLPRYWSCLHIVRRRLLDRRFAEWIGGEIRGGSPGDSLRAILAVIRAEQPAAPVTPPPLRRRYTEDLALLDRRLGAERSREDSLRVIREVVLVDHGPTSEAPSPPIYAYTALVEEADRPQDCNDALPGNRLTTEFLESRGLRVHATPVDQLVPGSLLRDTLHFGDPDFGLTQVSAARWDGDFGHGGNSQHITLRCGNAWCDVMPTDAGGPVPDLVPAALRDPTLAARTELKGWYDQQYLAVPDARSQDKLVPGTVLATYAPVDGLADLDSAAFDSAVVVGYIHLDGPSGPYHEKLNLSEGLNQVTMLRSTSPPSGWRGGECPPPANPNLYAREQWWVMIGPVGQPGRPHCSLRHPHPSSGPKFPGLARWRWLDDDETTWQRCPDGCCPVN